MSGKRFRSRAILKNIVPWFAELDSAGLDHPIQVSSWLQIF